MTSCHERRLQDQVGDDLGGFVMEAGGDVAVDAEGDGDGAAGRRVDRRSMHSHAAGPRRRPEPEYSS